MIITRIADAKRYDAPKHFDMRSLRLQGFDVSKTDFGWLGLSYFLPGGGAEMDSGPIAKMYVVLEGEVSIELANGETHVLRKLDSCYIAAGEARAIRNAANSVATMLVAMPYPPEVAP